MKTNQMMRVTIGPYGDIMIGHNPNRGIRGLGRCSR